MKKRIIFIAFALCLLVFRGFAAEEAKVSPEANRLLNLWCQFEILGDRSFDLDQEIQKVVRGKKAKKSKSWDVFVKHARLAQKDKKTPPQVKFGTLYVLNESRRRASAYFVELATRQMVPVLGGIQKEADVNLKRNAGYGDRFRFALILLDHARDVMNSGQDLLDKSPDQKEFEKLKQLMVGEIDLYQDVVAADMDRVFAWGSLRDDPKKKKEAEKSYAAAQKKYEAEIPRLRKEAVDERLKLLKKHQLDKSSLAHGGDLLDRYAGNVIKSEKQYEEKYSRDGGIGSPQPVHGKRVKKA